MPDYYHLLNLSPEASFIAIDDAYHRLSRLYSGDEVTLRLLREAFAVLSNPDRRDEYDRLRQSSAGERAGQAPPRSSASPRTEAIDTHAPAARPPRPHTEVIDTHTPAARPPRPHTEVIDTHTPAARPPRPNTELIDASHPGRPARPARPDTELFDAIRPAAGVASVPPGPIRIIVAGPNGQTTCVLDDGEHIIGRPSKSGPEPAVRLDGDSFVSRKHAMIIKGLGTLIIKDNKSVNGTRLNGQRLIAERPYPLQDQDTIEIEGFTLRVEFGAEQ